MANSALPIGIFNSNLINMQYFSTVGAHTYTPTTGTTKVLVKAWGGGAGGGSSNNTTGGGGGGAGAYVEAVFANTTSATITIGAGGTGALAANGSTATNGGNTSFGSILVAAGGTAPANGNNPGGAGGTLAACTIPSGGFGIPGSQGGDANGTNILASGGIAWGSNNKPFAAVAASAIISSGGGGSAGKDVANAGNGGSGLLIVYEFSSATPTTGSAAAIQAEMEAASSTSVFVSPGMQQYHPSAAKVWVNFNGTGTIAIRSSYNVTSLTDNGTGDYTINYTTAMSNTNYSVFGTRQPAVSAANNYWAELLASRAVGSSRWQNGENNVLTDASNLSASVFGDQ